MSNVILLYFLCLVEMIVSKKMNTDINWYDIIKSDWGRSVYHNNLLV